MPVPAIYIFRIRAPYTRTSEDDTEIANDSAENLKWENGYKTFKQNVKNYLKKEQNGRCAFCRVRISPGTSWANLEHLVSKTDYSQFKFSPENLVYCCTRCNMAKARQNTLSNPNLRKEDQIYPSDSQGFTIINPYYDDFETHIDFIDDIIIVVNNNSIKGRNTIEFYKLFRPELAEDRASELLLNQQTLNERLLNRLTSTEISSQTINQINAVIAEMPNWTI